MTFQQLHDLIWLIPGGDHKIYIGPAEALTFAGLMLGVMIEIRIWRRHR